MGDISNNYSRYEFACKCGCGFDEIDLRLMPILEAVRYFEGDKPITPNSACRCVKYNESIQEKVKSNYIPFSSQSRHLDGIAVDIGSDNPKRLYDFLDRLFPNLYGLGVYTWGIHIDLRQYKSRWNNI